MKTTLALALDGRGIDLGSPRSRSKPAGQDVVRNAARQKL